MTDIKKVEDKIKKLLRLAGSDNIHEAQLALTRARKLMAEHKLDIKDFDESDKKIVEVETDWYYTDYKDGYRLTLANVLAEAYCCVNYVISESNSKCRFITFRGYEDDVKVLISLYRYADDFIKNWFFSNKKMFKELCYYDNRELNAIKNHYGNGFAEGLKDLIEEQMSAAENQEWGLVMVVPEEAKKFVDSLAKTATNINIDVYNSAKYHNQGYMDGYSSNLHSSLTSS